MSDIDKAINLAEAKLKLNELNYYYIFQTLQTLIQVLCNGLGTIVLQHNE